MKHEVQEKTKRKNEIATKWDLGLRMFLILAMLLILSWSLFPIVLWGFNYLRWQNAHIEDYKMYLYRSDLLRDSDYIEPFDYTYSVGDGSVVVYPAHVFKADYDAVTILFSLAWEKMWNPFARCQVTYDEQYGFPDLISCGQWQQLQTLGFDPRTNN